MPAGRLDADFQQLCPAVSEALRAVTVIVRSWFLRRMRRQMNQASTWRPVPGRSKPPFFAKVALVRPSRLCKVYAPARRTIGSRCRLRDRSRPRCR